MSEIRISVTDVDSLRLAEKIGLDTDLGAKIERELIEKLQGKWPEMGWQAKCGCAFHELLGRPQECLKGAAYVYDGRFGHYLWEKESVEPVLSAIPPGLFECKTEKEITIGGHSVTLVGKCDHITGDQIIDFKCKFSKWSIEDYEAAFQWSAYLWMFAASKFTYLVIDMSQPAEDGTVKITDVTYFSFYPYTYLDYECRIKLAEYVLWLEAKGLVK